MGFPSPAREFPRTELCAGAHGSLLRRASPSSHTPENGAPWNFQSGSKGWLREGKAGADGLGACWEQGCSLNPQAGCLRYGCSARFSAGGWLGHPCPSSCVLGQAQIRQGKRKARGNLGEDGQLRMADAPGETPVHQGNQVSNARGVVTTRLTRWVGLACV